VLTGREIIDHFKKLLSTHRKRIYSFKNIFRMSILFLSLDLDQINNGLTFSRRPRLTTQKTVLPDWHLALTFSVHAFAKQKKTLTWKKKKKKSFLR
jgi:hypothetical protein